MAVILSTAAASAEPEPTSLDQLRDTRSESCEAFLDAYLGNPDCATQILMSRVMAPRFAACTPGHADLKGIVVRIAGYAHPFELGFKGVSDFLLIPRMRSDCRHAPPPAARSGHRCRFFRRFGYQRQRCLSHRSVARGSGEIPPRAFRLCAGGQNSDSSHPARCPPRVDKHLAKNKK